MSTVDHAASAAGDARGGLGLPIAIFAFAQFVMVLDSSVLNVSISQIVADLDTTLTGVNPPTPQSARDRVAQVAEKGIPVVPVDQVETAATEAGLSAEQAQELGDDYGDAQLMGLKRALGAVGVLALLALWFTRRLPGRAVT